MTDTLTHDVDTEQPTLLTANVNAALLHRALSAGVLAIYKDDSVPVLRTVHVFADSGSLFVEATDHHRLVRARLDWSGGDFDMLLDVDDAKRVLTLAKTKASEAASRQLLISVQMGDNPYIDVDDLSTRMRCCARTDLPTYPPTTRLIRDAVRHATTNPTEPVVLGSEYLADLKPFGELAFRSGGPNKPSVLALSAGRNQPADVVVIVMPRKIDDRDVDPFDISAILPE